MQSRSSLSELLNSLDAATYFFVSSGIFIAVTAALFFVLGVWLGGLMWGRYKRRFREAEDVIESFKGEVALLKRRIAEQSTRHSPSMGPSPLQAIAFKTAAPKASPSASETQGLPATPLPPSLAFTVWTEPDWKPVKLRPKKAPAKGGKSDAAGAATTKVPAMPELALFSVMDVFMAPRSRAYCIWTEKGWSSPPVKAFSLPVSQGFSIWMLPDFRPACRGAVPLGRAHSIWTTAGWTAPRYTGPPPRSARAFSVWTEPGWKPAEKLPLSKAFVLWTEPDFQPACRGALIPSQAGSIWTDREWVPAPVKPLPRVTAHPFSIWAEPLRIPAAAPTRAAPTSQSSIVAAAAAAVASITTPDQGKAQGIVARALAAAKQALGLKAPPASVPAPMPARTAEPAKVTVKPPPGQPAVAAASLAVTAAAVEALRQTGRVPVMSAPLTQATAPPSSKAFTVWIGDPTAAQPATKITQRIALAALIESKVATGKVALPPPQPAPVSPPPRSAPTAPPPAPMSAPTLLPPVPAVPVKVSTLAPLPAPVSAAPAPAETTRGEALRQDEKFGLLYAQEPPQKDMLSAIFSVDETMRLLLHKNGIYTFSQIAHWTPQQAEAFAHRLGIGDRIVREDWIGQAKVLHQSKHGSRNGS